MKSILAGFGLIALTDAFTVTDIIDVDPSKTAEAVFSENDITGTVTIDNGYIVIDLDLSAEPNLPGGYSACVSGGLKYHIHMKWDHDDLTDKINGTDCGADYTGGHWDPWHGLFLTVSRFTLIAFPLSMLSTVRVCAFAFDHLLCFCATPFPHCNGLCLCFGSYPVVFQDAAVPLGMPTAAIRAAASM